jgi:uncharacterized protein involved in response to NO
MRAATMVSMAARLRRDRGDDGRMAREPAFLSYGFRPFFLLGALYAGLAVLAWIPILHGHFSLATTALTLRDWHAHEMLYGFLPAVVTGFLLTAIPNWTGRLPIRGLPLLAMVLVWLAGRAAMTFSGWIGALPAVLFDSVFLPLLGVAAAREIVAGRNMHNLKVLVIILALATGNVVFHAETMTMGYADYGIRLGLAAVVMLLMLIGGRIVPSFTRNWLARENPGRLPAPFGRFDVMTIAAGAAALVMWIAAPSQPLTGAALIVGGVLQAVRLARWAGDRTFADRLVLILHIGYAFVPLGFILAGAEALALTPVGAGLHAWAAGAAGVMTLAVMTRATLGHTGRPLTASPGTQAIYAAVVLGAIARICAALHAEWGFVLLALSGATWSAAFLGFVVLYGPMLMRGRFASASRSLAKH